MNESFVPYLQKNVDCIFASPSNFIEKAEVL